jgi:valyl-tRNA synthetase
MKVETKKVSKLDESKMTNLDKYIVSKYNALLKNLNKNLSIYEISKTTKNVYDFIYNDFANYYLEMTKNSLEDSQSQEILFNIFIKILIMLHPYVPMVTENIYQHLTKGKSILEERIEPIKLSKTNKINEFELIKQIQYMVRKFRADHKLEPKEKVMIQIENKNIVNVALKFLGKEIELYDGDKKPSLSMLLIDKSTLNIFTKEKEINVNEIKDKIKFIDGEIKRAENMLSNKGFVSKAPKQLIDSEKEKLDKFKQEKDKLEQLLK